MDESGSGFRLDIQQILTEAQHRWLRPAEICEILRNYQKLHISPEAPTKPVSGSVFLFDRKVLRYFRKDGHNWRKKKDGKTVKEAHEKLKVGSVDMLHCYYAHGEENENFQRRSYWLLEQDLMHIVFVHYLEVKGSKASTSSARNSDGVVLNSGMDGSISSTFRGTSPTSPLSSAYEDGESDGNHQASSEFRPYPESPLAVDCHYSQSSSFNLPFSTGNQTLHGMAYTPLLVAEDGEGIFLSGAAAPVVTGDRAAGKIWQEMNNLLAEKSPLDQPNMGPFHSNLEMKAQYWNLPSLLSGDEIGNAAAEIFGRSIPEIGNESYSFPLKKPLLNTLKSEESLKKVDSFSRWMAKELGEADELAMQPSSGISWSIIGNEYESNMPAQLEVDTETLSPSISQDQFFSITDFSPHWAYSNRETKVLIAGMFLKGEVESSECRWSIMFGQVEVPAEVLGYGILCCRAPLHDPGLLPFYVTCSNRLACSEVREFEYRADPKTSTASFEANVHSATVMHLYQRFEMILHLKPNESPLRCMDDDFEKHTINLKLTSLIDEDNNREMDEKLSAENDSLHLGELLLQKKLKKQFFSWILHRVSEDGKGLTVFDDGGQSGLHLAAALGFNWSFQPFLIAGVSVDFRDVKGWTALHWAAFYGREEAVVALVSLGANPGALTDPCNECPLSRTPADLASSRGHKGISGFLAESSLTTHLSALRVKDDGAAEDSAVQTLSERVAAPTTEEDVPDKLSLKDSVAAVCNAAQAAARIHQIFRIQSFQRKQFENSSEELQKLDEQAISAVAGKTSRLGHSYGMVNAAAIQIQKKYRGWKKRKEFLLIRQKIVKIQAHVRGHQARKKYNRSFSWTVGIVEKVILRWRRKKNGLLRHQPNGVQAECSMQDSLPLPQSPAQDDYEAWKKGRKETEVRMQKALARVKSMAQHPEARAQYRRLLTASELFRESKDTLDFDIPDAMGDDVTLSDENLIDFESLLDDETFMSLNFP